MDKIIRSVLLVPTLSTLIILLMFSVSSAQQCQDGGVPSLSAFGSSAYGVLTVQFVGIEGSNTAYALYGNPEGEPTTQMTTFYDVDPGEQVTANMSGLRTNTAYTFYLHTLVCGQNRYSNTASATTRDIEAPSLSATQGPGFGEITLNWTAVPGAELTYFLMCSPGSGMPFDNGSMVTANQWGQAMTSVRNGCHSAFLDTNTTYYFKTFSRSGTRVRDSNIASATTRDIEAPQLSVTKEGGNARLSWSQVEGAYSYDLFTFSTAQNQWNHVATIQYTDPLTYLYSPATGGHTLYFQLKARRMSRVRESNVVSINFSGDQDQGNTACYASVGKPINVSTGNMYLTQSDYALPGSSIDLARTYNSFLQSSGMFGFGWTTDFDVNIYFQDQYNLRLGYGDGRGIYFGRTNTTHPFTAVTRDFYGQIVRNADSTYELTFKDGRIHKFSSTGKLLWQRDQNGNQTTLNYDANNFLTSVTDSFGRTLTLTPNVNGTISQISDSLGVIATYEYFPSTSLLKTVTYADGSKYKFEYDTTTAPGKTLLKTVKDALDNILETHEYDSQGRATTSEKHGGAEKYTLDYSHWTDAAPYTSVTHRKQSGDPPIETKYYFDKSRGRNVVTKTEGVCSCGGTGSEVTQYFYDAKLNLIRKIDALSNEINSTFDANGNMLTQTDIFGTQEYTYNTFGQVLTYKDRMNGIWTNTYDAAGNLKTVTDALGKVTTIEYPATNNKGLPDWIKDARNNVTKFKWYTSGIQNGLLEEIEDPYTKKTKFTYDARGRIKTVTNALDHLTRYNYFDDTQRKVEFVYPNLDKITYKYDIRRLLESVTDERGKITVYEFDPQYRLKKITDPLGHFREFGYDLMSNMISYKDPLGNVTDYVPDDFNRLKKIVHPPSTTGATRLEERFEYDKLGRIKKRTDTTDVRWTDYAYDDVNRTVTVTNAIATEQETTTLKYNQRFQTIEVKDALNQIYTFSHDPLGRLLSQTRAGGTMTFEYDEVGNRKKRIDYMNRETKYTYDNLNRLKEIEYLQPIEVGGTPLTPNLKSTYGYDDISRLTSAANEMGTVAFNYDNRNRTKNTTDVYGHLLEYEYERTALVNQKRLKFDGAMYATYNFDNAERLSNIVNASDSTTITFGYDNEDKLISRAYPNGVSTTYSYDDMDRLTRLKDFSSSATLFDRQYAYNNANQIESITEPSLGRTFTYDLVDRLKTVTASNNQNENYGYDDVGNRTTSHRSATYTHAPNNKLTSTPTAEYGYDANGNTVWKSEAPNFWRYTWDYENKMGSASTRRQSVRYKYDALGRRVQRYLVGNKENTKFIHDGLDVLVDDDSGTLTKYINGLGIDNKLRVQNGSAASYFLTDHLGSTNGIADSTGNLTSSTSYDSFGNTANLNFSSRYQFTGREFDNFTGLHFYRARFYDANLGRFISEDPIGFGGGDTNLYGYVRNQPLWYRDPSGLQPGADVIRSSNTIRDILTAGAAVLAVVPAAPVAVAVGGAATIYGAAKLGNYTANHPSNPFVNGPLNPFGTPYPGVPPISTTTTSRPYCQPVPRAVPFERAPTIPFTPPIPSNGGGSCEAQFEACLMSPSQPPWNISDFGTRKDCGACYRECKNNGGIWPAYKCPIN